MGKGLKHIVLLVIGSITVLTLGLLVTVNVMGLQVSQFVQQLGQVGAVEETDLSQPVLLKSIENISQYHAAIGNFEVVVDNEEDVGWLPSFIAGRRTLFVAGGTVNAYIDLSKVTDSGVAFSADGKVATIDLPEPQLDKPNLDPERTYMFDQERGVANRIADSFETPDQRKFYQLAETKMAAAAEASELRAQAVENTKVMLTSVFGVHGVQVAFEEDTAD